MKVILLIIDGLNYDVAAECMGHLQAYCDHGAAQRYLLNSELPSISRPLYETILTGRPPIETGIVSNEVVRLSHYESVFHYASKAGLVTAAATYHWVSELYNRAPFVPARDRHTQDENLPIQYGHFYYEDDYPDSHLIDDGESLRRQYSPDLLVMHSMNIDDNGHKHGLDSPQYRNAARRVDILISRYLKDWLDAGYQVLITADHGMNDDHSHGGSLPEERRVPLYTLGTGFSMDSEAHPTQLELCGTVCELLGVAHDRPFCGELLA